MVRRLASGPHAAATHRFASLGRWCSWAALIASVLVTPAQAATFRVDRTDDTLGVPSLRQAIIQANGSPGADLIRIDVTGTIQLTRALDDLTSDIEIVGPGAGSLSVRGEGSDDRYRIFRVRDGATVRIAGLTVTFGSVRGFSEFGGGIYNQGTLTLDRVAVVNNTVRGVDGGPDAPGTIGLGGGIASRGTLTLRESTIRENVATGGAGGNGGRGGPGGGGVGGGIAVFGGTTTVDRSLISGNFALGGLGGTGSTGGSGGSASGGGIYVSSAVSVLTTSTISTNEAFGGGGGFIGTSSVRAPSGGSSAGGLLLNGDDDTALGLTVVLNKASEASSVFANGDVTSIGSSLIGGPRGGGNCALSSRAVSRGFNLISDSSCARNLNTPTDQNGVDAEFGPLEDNEGPTLTHAIPLGSPAVDRGTSFGATTDQRGKGRPHDVASASAAEGGDGSDVGAYELRDGSTGPSPPTPPTPTTPTPTSLPGSSIPPGVPIPLPNFPAPGTAVKESAKLKVARAQVLRSARILDVLAPITKRASGEVEVRFRAAGRTLRSAATVDAARGVVRVRRKITAAQARMGTGILTLVYPGDGDTRPQTVRLRAASRKAELGVPRPALAGTRLKAAGTISRRARGVVRVELEFGLRGGTEVRYLQARVKNGRWSLDARLSDEALTDLAAREGTVNAHVLFTGYLPRRMRGEQRSFQVLPAP